MAGPQADALVLFNAFLQYGMVWYQIKGFSEKKNNFFAIRRKFFQNRYNMTIAVGKHRELICGLRIWNFEN